MKLTSIINLSFVKSDSIVSIVEPLQEYIYMHISKYFRENFQIEDLNCAKNSNTFNLELLHVASCLKFYKKKNGILYKIKYLNNNKMIITVFLSLPSTKEFFENSLNST